ncbi:HD domain-containing protein [bacterium]|nr:HD domain-containing protein [bacterium]
MTDSSFLTTIPQNSRSLYFDKNNQNISSPAQNPFKQSTQNDYCTFSYKQKVKPKNVFSFKQIKENYENYLLEKKFKFWADKKEIENMISANPAIKKIININGMKKIICIDNLQAHYKGHFLETMKVSEKICKVLNLPDEDIKKVKEAALFHDFGKVLIPEEILNKKDKLTNEERQIIHLHEILGYELLKTTNMDKDILQIIKNHHTHKSKLANDRNALLTQIVSVADIYTALTAERPYKKAMSITQSFEILNEMCEENKIDKNIVKALKTSLKEDY